MVSLFSRLRDREALIQPVHSLLPTLRFADLVVLDAFWPLSMVGLIVIGLLVARAATWPSSSPRKRFVAFIG